MTEAVIVDAVRTPLGKGKPGGAYSDIHTLSACTLSRFVRS